MAIELKDLLADNFHIFRPEDYGAVALNPASPDSGIDSSAAIQDCINDALSKSKHPVILLTGLYALDNNPVQTINGVSHNCQLYIPYTAYNTTSFKTLSLLGISNGNFEAQGITPMATPYNGCGFYSRYMSATIGGSVIGFEKSATAGTFQVFNYTNVHFDKIDVLIKTHSGSTQVSNNMSGIDLQYINQMTVGTMRIRATSPTYSSIQPPTGNFGIRTPLDNNHGLLPINRLYVSGFDVGAYLGEHCQVNHLIAVGNYYGIDAVYTYPISICHYTAEMNAVSIRQRTASQLSIDTYQSERRASSTGVWYYGRSDFELSSPGAAAHLRIGKCMVHMEGTGFVQPTVGSGSSNYHIDVQRDENGVCHSPLNVWATAGRPTPITVGVWGYNTDLSKFETWNGAAWAALN
jgi:hypothetical protein